MRATLAILCGLFLVGGCDDDNNDTNNNDNGEVTVVNDAFNPATVSPDGDGKVTWTWSSGGTTHNVTFEGGLTGSGNKDSGTFTQTFDSTGTYRYRCTIHSTDFTTGMVGSVVVP